MLPLGKDPDLLRGVLQPIGPCPLFPHTVQFRFLFAVLSPALFLFLPDFWRELWVAIPHFPACFRHLPLPSGFPHWQTEQNPYVRLTFLIGFLHFLQLAMKLKPWQSNFGEFALGQRRKALLGTISQRFNLEHAVFRGESVARRKGRQTHEGRGHGTPGRTIAAEMQFDGCECMTKWTMTAIRPFRGRAGALGRA